MARDLRSKSPPRRCHHAHDAVVTGLSGLWQYCVQDGAKATTVGRAMGSDRRLVSPICFTEGRRQATVPAARLSGRNLVDPSQWSTMEIFTKMFSFASYLLASPAMLGRIGTVCRDVDPAVAAFRRPAANRLDRSVGGWNIRPRNKGGACVGKTKCGKGTKIMVLSEAEGIPLAAEIHSASPAEVTLIESLLDEQPLPKTPQRLIYDMAADSDPLRERLRERGIELICPHRKNRVKPATQDGRRLRRYRKRYKIERLNSWIQNFRRLVVRYEHIATNFLGFVQLACAMIVMRKL
jgi:transposase